MPKSKKTAKFVEYEKPEADQRDYELVVNVNSKWRFVKIDKEQWQLQNLRMPEITPLNKDKERKEKWMVEGYFPSLHNVAMRTFDKMCLDQKGKFTLQEYVNVVKEVRNTIMAALGYAN